MFVPVAAVSVVATTIVVGLLKWREVDSKTPAAREGHDKGENGVYKGDGMTCKSYNEYV